MKKTMRKTVCLTLLVSTLLASAGCGAAGPGPQEAIDKTKTQLRIYNFDGGVGTDWLYELETAFEAKYAEVPFEKDKKGVQVLVVPGKDNPASITSSNYDILFTEGVYYNDLIASGELLDISDIVTGSLSEMTGGIESQSIADKIDPFMQDALTAIDGKYYCLPHYETYSGVTYDKKVFNEYELYFDKASTIANPVWTGVNGELSCGPDGVYDTYDDGLPSSNQQFSQLITRMLQQTVVPFMWAGEYKHYANNMLLGMWANNEGKEDFMYNVTFDSGEDTKEIVTGFTSSGDPIIEELAITPETGYLTLQSAGKYYAYEFFADVMSNSANYSNKIVGTLSHTNAQREYIYSYLENKPIGMLVEGSYWYNEASDALKASEGTYKKRAQNREFAFMPLPTQAEGIVTEGNGKKNTLINSLASFAVINNNLKDNEIKANLAKSFLQFCYTDEALQMFTTKTGSYKGVNYSLTPDQKEGLCNYYTSITELRENSDIIYPYADSKIFVNNQAEFVFSPSPDSSIWSSTVGKTPYSIPYDAFKNKISAKDYFNGSLSSASKWSGQYSKYWD